MYDTVLVDAATNIIIDLTGGSGGTGGLPTGTGAAGEDGDTGDDGEEYIISLADAQA